MERYARPEGAWLKATAIAQTLDKVPVGAVTPESITVDNARAIVKLDAKRPTQVPAFNQAQATIR
ncbi:hypothetical protein WL14_04900 [Burkholderia cepacia]|nr:hypothetical protein WL14_04900 [Burkholderia cepacia]